MATSRIGRKPVAIPSGVDVKVSGQDLTIKGPKGQVVMAIDPSVEIHIEDGHVKVATSAKGPYSRSGSGSKKKKSMTGTTRAKIFNTVVGVTKGFERKLLLVGVGYKAQSKGKLLGLTIGFSHPVDFSVPEGITIETPSPTEIIVKGVDKHLVGHTASKIRAVRGPEPYKGKGIRYADEQIIIKETKKK